MTPTFSRSGFTSRPRTTNNPLCDHRGRDQSEVQIHLVVGPVCKVLLEKAGREVSLSEGGARDDIAQEGGGVGDPKEREFAEGRDRPGARLFAIGAEADQLRDQTVVVRRNLGAE